MTPEDIDRILSSEDSLEPSANFAMEVMAAVRLQAAEPPPLVFPWRRFAGSLVASAAMTGAGTVLLARSDAAMPALTAALAPLAQIAPELGYATAALLVTLALATLPRLVDRT